MLPLPVQGGIIEPFDTVKIKKKGGLAWLSVPAEETVSMQLFSQRQHLVEFAAKQEVEVCSAHWYGENGMARIMVRGLIGDNSDIVAYKRSSHI